LLPNFTTNDKIFLLFSFDILIRVILVEDCPIGIQVTVNEHNEKEEQKKKKEEGLTLNTNCPGLTEFLCIQLRQLPQESCDPTKCE
jgi:hypothetical protein